MRPDFHRRAGIVHTGEQCDDGNPFNGDGCDTDCTWTCTAAGDCDDDQVCNGAETCQVDHTCAAGTPASETTACDLPAGGTGHCRGGVCVAADCGNGVVETGEACDDGNPIEGDGCDNDCTYSCTESAQCDDGLTCNGAEACNTTSHMCEAGAALDDGTVCDVDGDPSSRDICLGGACRASTCGDAFVDAVATPAEECDDGGTAPGDGCEADCRFTCHDTAADCDDDDPCNGVETCDPALHLCTATAAPADGTLCDADGLPATRDICISSLCVPSICGDGYIDTGASLPEQCEDGNAVAGDGCDPDDCRFSCMESADCSDGNMCNGAETCDTGTHVCGPGAPAVDGTVCTLAGGSTGACRSGECVAAGCGNGVVEPGLGEECEDGNTIEGDGCEPDDCTYTCHVAPPDCDDLEPCTMDACNTGGTGKICSNTPLTGPCAPLTPNLCYGGFVCVSAVCTGQEPVSCDDDNPCSSDSCIASSGCHHVISGTPHYPDGDHDGYGTSAVDCTITLPHPHPDWAHQPGDCCDFLPGVNPGQTAFFGASYTCFGGGGTFDYDCSTVIERQFPELGSCEYDFFLGGCIVHRGWQTTIPLCGDTGTRIVGCESLGDYCFVSDTVRIQQRCH